MEFNLLKRQLRFIAYEHALYTRFMYVLFLLYASLVFSRLVCLNSTIIHFILPWRDRLPLWTRRDGNGVIFGGFVVRCYIKFASACYLYLSFL